MDDYYQQLDRFEPSRDLSPLQVVQMQLEALQNNDLSKNNQGIRICFRFASPGNQQSTGPIEHFIELLKNPIYHPMIGFEQAEFTQTTIAGNEAQQTVRLIRGQRNKAVYRFFLSRQTYEPYMGCWMTDAVLRIT